MKIFFLNVDVIDGSTTVCTVSLMYNDMQKVRLKLISYQSNTFRTSSLHAPTHTHACTGCHVPQIDSWRDYSIIRSTMCSGLFGYNIEPNFLYVIVRACWSGCIFLLT